MLGLIFRAKGKKGKSDALMLKIKK